MILDEYLEFADAASVGTPNNAIVNVGDQIDLGIADRDPGNGRPLYLVVQVTTAFSSIGAATASFLLSSDDTTPIAVNGTQTTHYESDVFALSKLVPGFAVITPLPVAGPIYERYLGFQVRENAGQALNAGAVNAFLTFDPSRWQAFADAVN